MQNSKPKIIFLGTPQFAVPSLELLFTNNFELQCVITQPDRPSGRGQKLIVSPVKKFSNENNLMIFQPERISKDVELIETLKKYSPDLMITCAFGQILSQEVIDIPKWGIWNVHASLLPRWRGAAPIQWSLLAGDSQTGIAIMMTEKGLDTGPVLNEAAISILQNDTSETLADKLSVLGAELLLQTIDLKRQDKLVPKNQAEDLVTYASKISKEMGFVSFAKACSVSEILRMQRALTPWPGLFVKSKTENETIKIFDVSYEEADQNLQEYRTSAPGQIYKFNNKTGEVWIKALNGAIKILFMQSQSRPKIKASEWLRNQIESKKLTMTELQFD